MENLNFIGAFHVGITGRCSMQWGPEGRYEADGLLLVTRKVKSSELAIALRNIIANLPDEVGIDDYETVNRSRIAIDPLKFRMSPKKVFIEDYMGTLVSSINEIIESDDEGIYFIPSTIDIEPD